MIIATGGAQRNPWIFAQQKVRARFSGRQNPIGYEHLSPAKAGSDFFRSRYPGFRSLRSLHPGLNSFASFAGSLSYSSKEFRWLAVFLQSFRRNSLS